jgi:hypothetical protein
MHHRRTSWVEQHAGQPGSSTLYHGLKLQSSGTGSVALSNLF